MAKRSVRKARQREHGATRPAATPVGSPSRRQFWLGVLAAAVVLIPLAVVGVVIASGGDAADPVAEEAAANKASIESEAAILRKQTQVRDKEQVQELTDRMRTAADNLGPVLAGMGKRGVPSVAAVANWRAVVRNENEYFADTVSGETGTNVARGGFASALDILNEAVETYALARQDARLLPRAREQRDLAVRTWSVAATQLDAINIATGFGHQHVYLGGSAAAGGFTADPAPEGSGSE